MKFLRGEINRAVHSEQIILEPYGENIVQFGIKSTTFGTVIVLDELISFSYGPIVGTCMGEIFETQGWDGYYLSFVANLPASFR